jgi:hypothetical protein
MRFKRSFLYSRDSRYNEVIEMHEHRHKAIFSFFNMAFCLSYSSLYYEYNCYFQTHKTKPISVHFLPISALISG